MGFDVSGSFSHLGVFSRCRKGCGELEGVAGGVPQGQHIFPLRLAVVLEHGLEGQSGKALGAILEEVGGRVVDGDGADSINMLFEFQFQVRSIDAGLRNVKFLSFYGFDSTLSATVPLDGGVVLREVHPRTAPLLLSPPDRFAGQCRCRL